MRKGIAGWKSYRCNPSRRNTFLQPNASKELIDLMIRCHACFQAFAGNRDPYYLPGRWFPHITVGKNHTLEEGLRTMQFVAEQFTPRTARVEQLSLVEIEYAEGKVSCRNLAKKPLWDRSG
jgi:2'-5' RNA ligase